MGRIFSCKNLWAVCYALLALLFLFVLKRVITEDVAFIWNVLGFSLTASGSYAGLLVGVVAYFAFLPLLIVPNIRVNFNWFLKFTHEFSHALVALLFFRRIEEFRVLRKEERCYVYYSYGPIGNTVINLAPYCIPIYTFMLIPFRFWGGSIEVFTIMGYGISNMVIIDILIAFTYLFHIHAFALQMRLQNSDIQNCGVARAVAFIVMMHLVVLSFILLMTRYGAQKAIFKLLWYYPCDVLL